MQSSLGATSLTFCVAVNASQQAFVYDGTTWSEPTLIDPDGAQVSAVGCASERLCVAVDTAGRSAVLDGTWSIVPADPHGGVSSVACAVVGACTAVDYSGYAVDFS